MNESEVVSLMGSSKSEEEWNSNCDKVKKTFGGYPEFWYQAVVLSGLLGKTQLKWIAAQN